MFKIIAQLEAYGPIVVKGNYTGLSVTTLDGTQYVANAQGKITIDIPRKDEVEYIFREFPLSQYGSPYETTSLGITSNAWSVVFGNAVPAFIGGALYTVPKVTINLQSIQSNAASTTFYVYCALVLGIPQYIISVEAQAETETRMNIGTVVTNTTGIASINIQKVSRFGLSRPNVSQHGGSFPVSTGMPSQAGTINW